MAKKMAAGRRMPKGDRLLLLLSILMICGSALALGYVSLMNWSPLAEVVSGESGAGSGGNHTVSIGEDIKTPSTQQQHTVNFLVTGIDYTRNDTSAGTVRGQLTDVIMVVQLDLDNNNVDVLQIPRV